MPILFLALTVFAVVLSYLFVSLQDFYSYKKFVSPEIKLSTEHLHYLLRNRLRRDYFRFTNPEISPNSLLDTYHITVDEKKIQLLNSALPVSGKEDYVPAFLKINDEDITRKIELRYRGTLHFHWFYEKKSLRIKTKKRQLINSSRRFNLVNMPHKSMLVECVNYNLSRKLGLVSPDYLPIRLFVNGRYMGVYMFLSEPDESLLRKHRRMPGSIYEDGNEIVKNGRSQLWDDEKFWKKIASRNKESKNDRFDISRFLEGVNLSKQEFYSFYKKYINHDNVMTFLSLDTFFGSHHHDLAHNHRLYFDPYKGAFEWIQWDIRYWRVPYANKDLVLHPLLRNVKLNPILEAEKDKKTFSLLQSYTAQILASELDHYYQLVAPDFAADNFRVDGNYDLELFPRGYAGVFSMDEYAKAIEFEKTKLNLRHTRLKRVLNQTDIQYHYQQINPELSSLTFSVGSNSPVIINLSNFIKTSKKKDALKVFRDSNFNRQLDDADKLVDVRTVETLYPGRKVVSGNAMDHYDTALFGNDRIVNSRLLYSYLIKGSPAELPKSINGVNAITGNIVEVVPVDNMAVDVSSFADNDASDSIHPWQIEEGEKKEIVFKGEVVINESQVFDNHTQVLIKPGTRFLLYPGTSLFFYGKVTAVGSEDKPIVFSQFDKGKSWGAVVLQGQKTSGSVFQNVVFDGGGTAKRNLISYPGQVNIHDNKNITLKKCTFSNNKTGDDNLHLAYTDTIVESCQFINSNMDALDADISSLIITKTIFSNSGNDSLDLMTTNAEVSWSVFKGSGDKGVSVGESSRLVLQNSYVDSCSIGIEVKDESKTEVSQVYIADSKKRAINLYNKNYRYNYGGEITGGNVFFTGNKTVSADKRSKIMIDHIFHHAPDIDFIDSIKKLPSMKALK